MNFGYVGYLLKILLKITMLAYIFKMICVMVIVETVLKFIFEWCFWDVVLIFCWMMGWKVCFEMLFWNLGWMMFLNDGLYEIVMKWWWKCRGGAGLCDDRKMGKAYPNWYVYVSIDPHSMVGLLNTSRMAIPYLSFGWWFQQFFRLHSYLGSWTPIS